jgi:hypothetical protein
MMKRTLACVVVVGAWTMASGTVQAHHSLAGVYDMKAEKEVTGTLTKIEYVNPHGSLRLEAKDPDGTTKEWVFTTGSATTLAERGIGRSSKILKPGDTITAKFIPARNGNPLGFLKSLTLADGKVIEISNGNPAD